MVAIPPEISFSIASLNENNLKVIFHFTAFKHLTTISYEKENIPAEHGSFQTVRKSDNEILN